MTRWESRGHALAALGGLALALSLWLPWYSFRIPSAAIGSALALAHSAGSLAPLITAGAQLAGHLGGLHATAWQAYTTLPVVLVVCAVIGGGLAALTAAGRAEGVWQLVALAGVVGGLLVLSRLVAPPLDGQLLHPAWGLFLALGGALAMAAGGAAANRADNRALLDPQLPLLPSTPSWSTATLDPATRRQLRY